MMPSYVPSTYDVVHIPTAAAYLLMFIRVKVSRHFVVGAAPTVKLGGYLTKIYLSRRYHYSTYDDLP